MEQNTAILIADLSGYTALTEAHGASTAANTIDKFLNIVFSSLVGNSQLHERIGDEVMIVSNSADELMETTLKLNSNCLKEHYFFANTWWSALWESFKTQQSLFRLTGKSNFTHCRKGQEW